ncbi:hypothetical protein Q5P01_013105 [Channa striata]|uniref:Uncharacterized protein n=1 Tax=Channa striata TaxID=64152 RepID=A0AA88STU3_CHASR|nr:hypothetical protein Q5P01_013105 [Channa striata]
MREERRKRREEVPQGKEAGDVNTSCIASRLGQAYPVSTPPLHRPRGERGGGSEKRWRVENCGLRASKEGIQATSGPAAASCCLPNAPRHPLTTTIEHPRARDRASRSKLLPS